MRVPASRLESRWEEEMQGGTFYDGIKSTGNVSQIQAAFRAQPCSAGDVSDLINGEFPLIYQPEVLHDGMFLFVQCDGKIASGISIFGFFLQIFSCREKNIIQMKATKKQVFPSLPENQEQI
jgi:hypothetical protein